MTETDDPITVEARLAWFLIGAAVVIFVGVLFWGFLNPHVGMMENTGTNITNATTDDASTKQAYQTGWNRVSLLWRLWPAWFGFLMLLAGFRRAINESSNIPQ